VGPPSIKVVKFNTVPIPWNNIVVQCMDTELFCAIEIDNNNVLL